MAGQDQKTRDCIADWTATVQRTLRRGDPANAGRLARFIQTLPATHNDIKRVPPDLKAEWIAQLQALANGA